MYTKNLYHSCNKISIWNATAMPIAVMTFKMFIWNKQSPAIICKIQMKTKGGGIRNERTSSGLEKADSSF
jgi:hypothetical protein